MKYLAIIQARMDSTRLPGKVLLKINDIAVIDHVYYRVKQSKYIDDIVIATSIEENNIPLIEKCARSGIRIFVGSEQDVLDRFYQVAKLLKPQNVVRITADCPLIDPDIIDSTIMEYEKNNVEYCNNIGTADGLGSEVFSFDVLKEAWKKADLISEREHVTPYIKKNFKTCFYQYLNDISDKRWTLDEQDDLKLIKIIYKHLYQDQKIFKTKEILDFLSQNPELEKINNYIMRDAGYQKSLQNDNNMQKNG